jgi:hypothetical protein
MLNLYEVVWIRFQRCTALPGRVRHREQGVAHCLDEAHTARPCCAVAAGVAGYTAVKPGCHS